MIKITRSRPTAEQLANLYLDAGWVSNPEKLDLQKSIDNTSMWIVAKDGKSVIGIARLQTDYVRYCCIYDLIVRSDKRRSGLGTKIMEEILAFCSEEGIQIVHLWPTKGKILFYKKFGFLALDSEQPVMIRIQKDVPSSA